MLQGCRRRQSRSHLELRMAVEDPALDAPLVSHPPKAANRGKRQGSSASAFWQKLPFPCATLPFSAEQPRLILGSPCAPEKTEAGEGGGGIAGLACGWVLTRQRPQAKRSV